MVRRSAERTKAADLVGRARIQRKLPGNVRLFCFWLLRERDRQDLLPDRKRVRAINVCFHDIRGRLFDAPARWRFPRRVYRPLWPSRRLDADAGTDGGRNVIHRLGAGLRDDWRASAGDRRDRPADPGCFRRSRARRRLGLPLGNRHPRPQGLLCQLAIRQPANRRHFRRAAWRVAEHDRPARLDVHLGLAHSVPDRLPDHSAPIRPAQFAAGDGGVREAPRRGGPSEAEGNPAAAR